MTALAQIEVGIQLKSKDSGKVIEITGWNARRKKWAVQIVAYPELPARVGETRFMLEGNIRRGYQEVKTDA